jgi:hypothetical protein
MAKTPSLDKVDERSNVGFLLAKYELVSCYFMNHYFYYFQPFYYLITSNKVIKWLKVIKVISNNKITNTL